MSSGSGTKSSGGSVLMSAHSKGFSMRISSADGSARKGEDFYFSQLILEFFNLPIGGISMFS